MLDTMFKRAPAQARKGLAMAINDIVELTTSSSASVVSGIDAELSQLDLPTLTEVRIRFSRDVLRAIKRGSIEGEVEYYTIRNAVDIWPDLGDKLWPMLTRYEQRLVPN